MTRLSFGVPTRCVAALFRRAARLAEIFLDGRDTADNASRVRAESPARRDLLGPPAGRVSAGVSPPPPVGSTPACPPAWTSGSVDLRAGVDPRGRCRRQTGR